MKKLAIAIVCVAAGGAFAQPVREEPVPVRVSQLSAHVRERVLSHAEQGVTSLARYLERTRMIHQLRLMDVVLGVDAWGFSGDADAVDRQIERDIREGRGRARR